MKDRFEKLETKLATSLTGANWKMTREAMRAPFFGDSTVLQGMRVLEHYSTTKLFNETHQRPKEDSVFSLAAALAKPANSQHQAVFSMLRAMMQRACDIYGENSPFHEKVENVFKFLRGDSQEEPNPALLVIAADHFVDIPDMRRGPNEAAGSHPVQPSSQSSRPVQEPSPSCRFSAAPDYERKEGKEAKEHVEKDNGFRPAK